MRKTFLRNITEAILASHRDEREGKSPSYPGSVLTLVRLRRLLSIRHYAGNSTSCHQVGAVVP